MNLIESLMIDCVDGDLLKSLYKLKIIAFKTKQVDILKWVNNEIWGYGENDTLPDFRRVYGTLSFRQNIVDFENVSRYGGVKVSEIYRTPYNSLTEWDSPIHSISSDPKQALVKHLTDRERSKFARIINIYKSKNMSECFKVIEYYEVLELKSKVIDKVLDFALLIESNGISGEQFNFTKDEVNTINNIKYNIYNSTVGDINTVNSNGVVGTVVDNGQAILGGDCEN